MKRGRPTKSTSITLDKEIRNLYSHGISPETAAQQLGLNRKTVYARYKEISDDIMTINETNFFEEIKSRIKQAIISYDSMLLDCYSLQDSIDHQLEQKIKHSVRLSLQNRKIIINKEIRNILNEKVDMELKIILNNSKTK